MLSVRNVPGTFSVKPWEISQKVKNSEPTENETKSARIDGASILIYIHRLSNWYTHSHQNKQFWIICEIILDSIET